MLSTPPARRGRTLALPRPRPVAFAAVLALLVVLLPGRPALAADAGAESQFVQLINQERAARGLPSLSVASDLVAVARRHSVEMADTNDLHHNSALGSEVGGWQKVGENVGRGPGVAGIHDAFMASPGHRANILDASWREVGVGVEVRDGTVWVTEVFRQPQEAAAPKPAPAAAPATSAPAPAPASTPAPAPAAAASAPAPSATTAAAAPIAPAPAAPPIVSDALTVCTHGDIPPVWTSCPA